MYLYKILFKKQPKKILFFSLLGILTGAINAYLFVYINQRINSLVSGDTKDLKFHVFSFIFIIWLFIFSRRFLGFSIINFTQKNLYELKSNLIKTILDANYTELQTKKNMVYNVLTRDISKISEAGNIITSLFTSIIIVVGCLTYVYFISIKLFFIICIIICAGVLSYSLRMRNLKDLFGKVKELNDKFIHYFQQLTSGFREIKVAKEKGKDIEENYIKDNLRSYYNVVVNTFSEFMNAQYIGEVLFYITIGFMLFFGGFLLEIKNEDLISFIFVLLFINGPIQAIVLLMPIIVDANISSKRLLDLQEFLTVNPNHKAEDLSRSVEVNNLESLEIKDLVYSYKSENTPFTIGPISLTIKKGEIIFIHGGNGSGKTSFIMCLLGILKKDSGQILINDKIVDYSFSSVFAPVFSDYFLFDKFYGNKNFDLSKAKNYLKLFELEDKVSYTEDGFSTILLSMGQRKRLVLIQALLEGKQIIVLDEWAADQDPYFRKKFYTEILPFIKQDGKSIIAITHDDKYFHIADKLFKMDFGKLYKQD